MKTKHTKGKTAEKVFEELFLNENCNEVWDAKGEIIEAMEEYGKQSYNEAIKDALKLASEKVEISSKQIPDGYVGFQRSYRNVYSVDKESILNLEKELLK
jgi:uncharacterized protein with NRDE domain